MMNNETTRVNAPKKMLEVKNLCTSFFTQDGEVKAVDDISFYLNEQEVIAIVGESGCGKSALQMSILKLIQSPPGKILSGEVLFEGQNLMDYDVNSPKLRAIRGAGIATIFQEPMTSLNPVMTIGKQLTEVIRTHRPKTSKKEATEIAVESLKKVGIPAPRERLKSYPFQLSGGMKQRIMAATAIACHSKVLIADEPTAALDVTTQAQVMDLLSSIIEEMKTSMVLVTHNLGLISRYARRAYVMYAGKIVESGYTEDILTKPSHPYTKGLLESVPTLDGDKEEDLQPIKGNSPLLIDLPDRCTFLPRCPYACDKCKTSPFPPLDPVMGDDEHFVACYLNGEEEAV